jgi:glycosyltransferase involved in cell wall biosynthesis
MKVALVHDYLAQDGGAERVLKSFHEIWPNAPIFVLFHDRERIPYFGEADIRESFISRMPFGRSKYQWYLPMMPRATERHNLHEFDLVLSSTSAFAKGVLTRPDTLHISYCHTPTRYLWTDTHEYIADLKYNRLVKAMIPRLIHHMRLWDKMSVDRVDHFVANSGTVRHRIQKYYRRDSDIIYPPVDIHQFHIQEHLGNYFLAGGRLVPYKRFDLLIQVFNRLGIPLKIFGDGPERDSLEEMAKSNIQFVGKVSDRQKADLFSHALAFLHPQIEDLGITPIESMAAGRPVIAFGQGGVTETVIPGKTGIFFHEQRWESLLDTIINFNPNSWDSSEIQGWAQKFSSDDFKDRLKKYVDDRYAEFQQGLWQCQLDVR